MRRNPIEDRPEFETLLFSSSVPAYKIIDDLIWGMSYRPENYDDWWEFEEDASDEEKIAHVKEIVESFGLNPNAKSAYLDQFILKDRFKRKGLGTKLFREFEQEMVADGNEYIIAQASELDGTHSLPFWQKMGFRTLPGTGEYPIVWKRISSVNRKSNPISTPLGSIALAGLAGFLLGKK